MPYIPTEWKKGDKITAEKLNNIESGVSAANSISPQIVYASLTAELVDGTYDQFTYHCNMTLAEILAALESGSFVILRHGDIYSLVSGYSQQAVTFSDYYIYNGKLYVTSIKVEANDVVEISNLVITGEVEP